VRGRPEFTDTERATTWQVASVLLGYPDAETRELLPQLRRAIIDLPEPLGGPLARFLDHMDSASTPDLTAEYVATFDQLKRCCLYLTYYAYGDTRKRGMALLRFKHAYRAGGLILDDGELPDHLAVVLEFAATGNARVGRQLLLEHRAGLELLRLALAGLNSPWTTVLDAVCATLPPLTGRIEDSIQRLAAEGPPEEQVGFPLFGYTDPALSGAQGATP